MDYSEKQLLQIAKRYNNSKRQYLLVNPLQAKHIPVSPGKAFDMMHELAVKIRGICPKPACIIGFAETATAIAAIVAGEFPANTLFLQTTRECADEGFVPFCEEHSHAPEQWIYFDALKNISNGTIVLIDDEISTGNTILNFVKTLQQYV